MAPKETAIPIFGFPELDSTNTMAESLVRAHDPALEAALGATAKMAIIFTPCQTSGRGQGDHKWFSDGCLTFTLVKAFEERELPAREESRLNDLVTEPILRFLESEGVDGARVKEPNDIWVGDRKIAGILIRNILEESWVRISIIGIGLNLNRTEFPSWLPNPVSLRQLTGREFSAEEVLKDLSLRILEKAG